MATIKQVSDLLNASKGEDHAPYYSIKGEYHDGEEIYDVIREALDEYNDDEEASEDEISEMLYERADGATPIYYSDIAKWFAENFNAVDEYIDEMGGGLEGAMGGADIMKTIQATYCYMLHRDAMKVLSDLIEQADDEDGLTN